MRRQRARPREESGEVYPGLEGLVKAEELIAILRAATDEDVANARRRAEMEGGVGSVTGEVADLLCFYNMMIDQVIDEAIQAKARLVRQDLPIARLRNLRARRHR